MLWSDPLKTKSRETRITTKLHYVRVSAKFLQNIKDRTPLAIDNTDHKAVALKTSEGDNIKKLGGLWRHKDSCNDNNYFWGFLDEINKPAMGRLKKKPAIQEAEALGSDQAIF